MIQYSNMGSSGIAGSSAGAHERAEHRSEKADSALRLTPDHIPVAVEVRELGDIGQGLFLREPVRRGDPVAFFGGRATPGHIFRQLPHELQQHAVQVADDVYLVSDEERTLGDYVNHSCDPTGVMLGEITVVAIRDLQIGEQLTYDYATTDSTPYDEFECGCGTDVCRGKVTGEDWMDRDVRDRYAGHFSPYLQRKIDALVSDAD